MVRAWPVERWRHAGRLDEPGPARLACREVDQGLPERLQAMLAQTDGPARSQMNGDSVIHPEASSISDLKGFPALTQSLGKVSVKNLSASSTPAWEDGRPARIAQQQRMLLWIIIKEPHRAFSIPES